MIGRACPNLLLVIGVRIVALAICALFCGGDAISAEIEIRLRLAWGSGAQSPQKWHGKITVAGAKLESLQPLGVEADEAAALRLVGDAIVVAPLLPRAFDGCDVTVRGEESAQVRFEFHSSPSDSLPAKTIDVPLAKLQRGSVREPLDASGGFVLAQRSPGDQLRVRFERDHLVFGPNEPFSLKLQADLKPEAAQAAVTVDARLVRVGSTDVLWQTSLPFDPAATGPMPIDLITPADEGAYRLVLVAAHRPAGLAERLMAWDHPAVLATRHVDFVVIDPARRSPRLTGEWQVVETIDPASSRWSQRLPQWAAFEKIPGIVAPRPLGNVKPTPVAASTLGMVELPAAAGAELAWQAYTLPVRETGQPYAVELDIPRGLRQHLAVSVIEPDAAGRVQTFGRDWGVYSDSQFTSADSANTVVPHRLVFWPRTQSPILLVANRSAERPVQYGKIRLLRRTTFEASADVMAQSDQAASAAPARLIAAYIGTPRFADSLGGAEELDSVSKLSVDGWETFLQGATRLAQQLRAAGYNAAVMAIAADGASLAPLPSLGSSPRFDSGLLASHGDDPVRKDILEAMLRVFDREGLRLVPTIQLAAPLPKLEELRAAGDSRLTGVAWIGPDGRDWRERRQSAEATAPHYNLLNADVRAGLGEVVDELLTRYGDHPSFAGVSLQISGNGYGLLPGLAWGMDDATARQFSDAAHIDLPGIGDDRFQQRAELVLKSHLAPWKLWRQEQVTQFYADLAGRVTRQRSDMQLVLCTEDLFNGEETAPKLRQAVNGRGSLDDVLGEQGFNPSHLAATPGIALLRARRIGDEASVDRRAVDVRINAAVELDHAVASYPQSGELLYHVAAPLRLPSFDAESPFGADKTQLAMQIASVPAGDDARRALVSALASRDFALVAEGGATVYQVDDEQYSELRRLFQELTPVGADVRTERRQPVTVRVYRESAATTICLINESPWPVGVTAPLECDAATAWRQLGQAAETATDSGAKAGVTGVLPAEGEQWIANLPPYGVTARRFDARHVHIGAFKPKVADEAKTALAARVAEIEQRLRSLDEQRAYAELQNPGFETAGPNGGALGWQPRVGEAGAVAFESSPGSTGEVALHLHSEDALGVAAQSQMFAMPATGQLVISARVRTTDLTPDAQLYAWMEYESAGALRQRCAPRVSGPKVSGEWTECEFALDDLPLGGGGQMRIHFHLAGRGDVWVDDVRLSDLWFPKERRGEMFKRLYAANTALDEGQLVDCQRLVEAYWARHLLEYVPAGEIAARAPISVASRPDETASPPTAAEGDDKAFGRRIRGIVPRMLR